MKKKLTIAFTLGFVAGTAIAVVILFQDEVLNDLFKEAQG
jgi:capsular polysaccharide biosynthesis protein